MAWLAASVSGLAPPTDRPATSAARRRSSYGRNPANGIPGNISERNFSSPSPRTLLPMTLTFASVQVVLPTKLELWRMKPYVLLGVGGKRYGFSEPTSPNEVGAVLPSNGFTWGGDLGGGFTLEVVGLNVDVQVRDAITRYWGKTQHDLLFTGGLLWRLW